MDGQPAFDRKLKVGICSTDSKSTIKALISKVSSLPDVKAKFIELPRNDLDRFHLPKEELDGVIICQSVTDRRGAITDLPNALYGNFLPRIKQEFGKSYVCAISHDFTWPLGPTGPDHNRIKDIYMKRFREKQPNTFKSCKFATICGRLDKKLSMDEKDWNQLEKFIQGFRFQPYIDKIKENKVAIAAAVILFSIVLAGVIVIMIPLVMTLYHSYILYRLKIFMRSYRIQQQRQSSSGQTESPVEFHEILKYLGEHRDHVNLIVVATLIVVIFLMLLFPSWFLLLILQVAVDYTVLFFLVPLIFRVFSSPRATETDSEPVSKGDWYWPLLISSIILYLFVLSEMYRVGGILATLLLLLPLIVKAYQIRKELSEKKPEQWFSDIWDMIKTN